MAASDTPGLLMTVNVTFNVPLLAIVLAVVAGILGYAGLLRYRQRRQARRTRDVARRIMEYFRQYELEVAVQCFGILGGQRFVAVVESPPIKRFRYSHIIESSLIQHLRQSAGAEIDKIYWRFPLAWQGGAEDPYFAEGQAILKKSLAGYEVGDATWESYQASRGADTGNTP